MMAALVIVIGLVLIVLGLCMLILADRRRRLERALGLLAQLNDERRARASAERRLARVEKELQNNTKQLERADNERARTSEVKRIHASLGAALPSGAGPIAVVSRGDDALIRFKHNIGWHFPQTNEGVYAGHHPKDSDAAIKLLEDVCRRGARYLLIPDSSSWWMDHYAGFRDYLTTKYQRVNQPGDGISALFQLTTERQRQEHNSPHEQLVRGLRYETHSTRPKEDACARGRQEEEPEMSMRTWSSTNGDGVTHDGLLLPPPRLRFGGSKLRDDDDYYIASACGLTDTLRQRCALTTTSRVLDVGCGQGRLLIGIQATMDRVAEYVGFDVHGPSIDWASKHLARAPWIRFERVDGHNDRYNAAGRVAIDAIHLPAASSTDGKYDCIVLFSVFTHMRLQEIVTYLGEIRRVLSPQGRAYVTAFVEDGVPDEVENPPEYGYGEKWSGPLHCVRINRDAFEHYVSAMGLQIEDFQYRENDVHQSSYVLSSAR
ncbi:MAG: class I SAM-dependent methyltransferase [Actinomycetota bacterium]|nr:class I SAM-dependent methyltransferase [Actinomycetota bacterium]